MCCPAGSNNEGHDGAKNSKNQSKKKKCQQVCSCLVEENVLISPPKAKNILKISIDLLTLCLRSGAPEMDDAHVSSCLVKLALCGNLWE